MKGKTRKKREQILLGPEICVTYIFCKVGKTCGCLMIIARGPTGTSSSQDLLLLITEDARGQTWHTIKAGYCREGNRSHNRKMFLSPPYLLSRHGTTAGKQQKMLLERLHQISRHTDRAGLRKDGCTSQKIPCQNEY